MQPTPSAADVFAELAAAPKRQPVRPEDIVRDVRGRALLEPWLPRKSSGTVVPVGKQWIAHDRADGQAAKRRVRQMQKRNGKGETHEST